MFAVVETPFVPPSLLLRSGSLLPPELPVAGQFAGSRFATMGFIAVEQQRRVSASSSPSAVRGASRRLNAIRAGKRNVTVEPGRGRLCCCRRALSTASDHAVFFRTVSSLQLPYRSSVLVVPQAHPKLILNPQFHLLLLAFRLHKAADLFVALQCKYSGSKGVDIQSATTLTSRPNEPSMGPLFGT
ncbi:hypothetical protein SASPL_105095 [Salvia splendens]|uniref:Uncharacterized protein n=1 Tax=Salvia splendens TaxID=180675 RepID=A0A8X9AAE9_SALSN|nr:hypothetical protein SASPL_105095 [Salvia splendens]